MSPFGIPLSGSVLDFEARILASVSTDNGQHFGLGRFTVRRLLSEILFTYAGGRFGREQLMPAFSRRRALLLVNAITTVRLMAAFLLLPLLTAIAVADTHLPVCAVAALLIFLVALLTDAVDGACARRLGVTTEAGALFDSCADKCLICTTLIASVPLIGHHLPRLLAPGWWAGVVVMRELIVTYVRVYCLHVNRVLPALRWGKGKMAVQGFLVAVVLCEITCNQLGWTCFRDSIDRVMPFMIWLTMVISIWSGIVYVNRARSVPWR